MASGSGISGSDHERRQHARRSSPILTLRIEGKKYKTLDWSLGGFRIEGFHREIRTGETLKGSVDKLGGLRREPFEVDVVRLTQEGHVCCRFLVMPKL